MCLEILFCLSTLFFLHIIEDNGKTGINLEILNQNTNVECDT